VATFQQGWHEEVSSLIVVYHIYVVFESEFVVKTKAVVFYITVCEHQGCCLAFRCICNKILEVNILALSCLSVHLLHVIFGSSANSC
jgi:Rieske Fe-S protein